MTPFDFVNAINQHKDLFATTENQQELEKAYVPFVINKALSYFQDSILYANEMNINHHLDKRMQNSFLLSIRPRRRMAKWHKSDVTSDVTLIQEYYGCSLAVAQRYAAVLSTEAVQQIKERLRTGGKE